MEKINFRKIKYLVTLIILGIMFLYPTADVLASCEATETKIDDIYLENGDYITTEIEVVNGGISYRASSLTGKKTITYSTANGTKLWSFTVTGTFSYTGSSSSCTYVTTSYSINSNAWKVTSTSSSKSGNTATGSVTAKEYFSFAVINTVNHTLTLSCSANGSIS